MKEPPKNKIILHCCIGVRALRKNENEGSFEEADSCSINMDNATTLGSEGFHSRNRRTLGSPFYKDDG